MLDCYPEPKRTELTGLLRDYTRHVIDVSWPEMQRGIVPRGSHAFVGQLQAALIAFEPTTQAQIALHRETLYRFAGMIEARRLRLDCVAWQLPAILWVVVLAGSFHEFCAHVAAGGRQPTHSRCAHRHHGGVARAARSFSSQPSTCPSRAPTAWDRIRSSSHLSR